MFRIGVHIEQSSFPRKRESSRIMYRLKAWPVLDTGADFFHWIPGQARYDKQFAYVRQFGKRI